MLFLRCIENIVKDHQFHIPLQRNISNVDACYDQGYGSERSPEDELPPLLPLIDEHQYLHSLQSYSDPQQLQQVVHQQQQTTMPFNYTNILEYTQLYQYDFITKGKSSRIASRRLVGFL